MCLEIIDKKVTFQEYGTYYKVFRRTSDGELCTVYQGSQVFKPGKWIEEDSPIKYVRFMNIKYKVGFHCFVSREHAESWSRLEHDSYKPSNSNLVTRPVKVKNIVAQGNSWRRKCIVAKQILVKEE